MFSVGPHLIQCLFVSVGPTVYGIVFQDNCLCSKIFIDFWKEFYCDPPLRKATGIGAMLSSNALTLLVTALLVGFKYLTSTACCCVGWTGHCFRFLGSHCPHNSKTCTDLSDPKNRCLWSSVKIKSCTKLLFTFISLKILHYTLEVVSSTERREQIQIMLTFLSQLD